MRALIVEDEPKVAASLQEALQSERFDVIVEHSGTGASTRLHAETFDVILLDLTLPGCDGLQLVSALRARGFTVTDAPLALAGWTVTDAQSRPTRVQLISLQRASGLDKSLFVLKDPRPKNVGRGKV